MTKGKEKVVKVEEQAIIVSRDGAIISARGGTKDELLASLKTLTTPKGSKGKGKELTVSVVLITGCLFY